MKIRFLLILSLLLSAVSCSKNNEDEPTPPDYTPDYTPDYNLENLLNSNPLPGILNGERTASKGWAEFKFVKKSELPEWLVSEAGRFAKGYVIKAGSGDDLLYLLYDKGTGRGQYYDAQGNPAQNNPKLKDWTIIYKWDPSCGLFTPLGWVTYMLVSKENLHSWLCTMTESIPKGYILMGGFPRRYYVYDEDKECGQYYDAQGNPLEDNSNSRFIDGAIIYKWEPAV